MVAFHEWTADLSLEARQRLTESRLRQVKPGGGTPEMQLGCQCLHVVQVAKLHIRLLVPTSRQLDSRKAIGSKLRSRPPWRADYCDLDIGDTQSGVGTSRPKRPPRPCPPAPRARTSPRQRARARRRARCSRRAPPAWSPGSARSRDGGPEARPARPLPARHRGPRRSGGRYCASSRLAARCAGPSRGYRDPSARMSVGSGALAGSSSPPRRPRLSGEYAMNPMPSSLQVSSTSASTPLSRTEYSLCRTAIGCTAAARRRSAGSASHRPDVPHLAGLDELGHGADGLFDRSRWIHAVLQVQIDEVDAETLQALRTCFVHVLRSSADPQRATSGIDDVSELRRDDRLVAPVPDGVPDQPLVVSGGIDIGGIEQIHPEIERDVDRTNAFILGRLAVQPGHRCTAEPDRADIGAVAPELTLGQHECPGYGSSGCSPIPAGIGSPTSSTFSLGAIVRDRAHTARATTPRSRPRPTASSRITPVAIC